MESALSAVGLSRAAAVAGRIQIYGDGVAAIGLW